MKRKLRLSPLQDSILRLLEEAGEENLHCIKATLRVGDSTTFDEGVRELERAGLIKRSVEATSGLESLILTESGRGALSQ